MTSLSTGTATSAAAYPKLSVTANNWKPWSANVVATLKSRGIAYQAPPPIGGRALAFQQSGASIPADLVYTRIVSKSEHEVVRAEATLSAALLDVADATENPTAAATAVSALWGTTGRVLVLPDALFDNAVKWASHQATAVGIISSAVEAELAKLLVDERFYTSAIDTLHEMFSSNTMSGAKIGFYGLATNRLGNGEDLSAYFKRASDCRTQMAEAACPISDRLFALALLLHLPDTSSFALANSELLSLSPDDFTVARVSSRLREAVVQEEARDLVFAGAARSRLQP
jgi:hypothetical protein